MKWKNIKRWIQDPRDYKAIWRSKANFNKFCDCLTKTEKKTHREALKYIRQCFLKAYTEAYRKEKKSREKTKEKLSDYKEILECFDAVEEVKNEVLNDNEV